MDANATHSVVTLDVLHTGIIWGWYVTMNFWAKSISTGVFLLGAFLLKQEGPQRQFLRLVVPAVAFVFINLTLLFTVLDLHQMFRFWHILVYTHSTSAIALGAWLLTIYTGATALMTLLAWKKHEGLYDALIVPTWILAFFSTIYTAALLGQANARELWQAPTESAQMILAATLAGSAVFLLVRRAATDEQRRVFAWVLALSGVVSLTLFVAEIVFAPMKSEEAEFLIHVVTSGRVGTLFFAGLTFGFVVPAALSFLGLRQHSARLYPLAAASSLVGLWMVKHAWLLAPQMIPLS